MTTFRDWIDEKTPQTLHVAIGVPHGTIRVWRHRNVIPRNIWPDILKEWRTLGADVNDLLSMESAYHKATQK